MNATSESQLPSGAARPGRLSWTRHAALLLFVLTGALLLRLQFMATSSPTGPARVLDDATVDAAPAGDTASPPAADALNDGVIGP